MVKGGTGDSEDQHLLLTEPLAQANRPKAQAIAFFPHSQVACTSDRHCQSSLESVATPGQLLQS